MSFTGVRDPLILEDIDSWAEFMRDDDRPPGRADPGPAADDEYAFDLRLYGYNAVLGDLDPSDAPPREVGVMLLVNAADQATATAVAKVANPLMLHLPTHGMDYLPSLAFPSSPAEVERGAAYEFVLNHVVDSITPTGMFRIEVPGATHV